MSEENHMGWKLVRGVRQDVVNLLKLFASTNSVRFEDFCKVWQEMNFSLIYSHRHSLIEILEFTEELLLIVKEYLSSVYEFHTRVAALYALYGLYFKQPIKRGAKIRFTKTEWEDVYALAEKCKLNEHYDIAFIFIKLYISGAFSFTAVIRPAGFERGFRKYSEKRNAVFSKTCDVELLYRPLISEKLVDSLVKLESLYCQKKSELLGSKNLVFINGNFAQSLKEELKSYALASENKYNKKNSQILTEAETDTLENSSTSSSGEPKATAKSSKTKKNLGGNKNDDDVSCKKMRVEKKYNELLAKKKAEYYIRKLQLENNEKNTNESTLGLLPLLDYSETEID